MSKKVTIDVKTLAICAIIIVGLVLAIVGLFGDFVKADGAKEGVGLSSISDYNDLLKKGDSKVKGFVPTAIFAWATFALAILTACAFVVKFFGVKLPKNVLLLLGALTALCAILAFIFSIVMASKYPALTDYKIAYGPILMLIGGLFVGCGAAASEKI